jgi:D-arabinose 5-phosphate isomerase GutQ/GTP:adenosylcobinamide-phosphate guanylyltransferase/thiamine kinase-like enzyme
MRRYIMTCNYIIVQAGGKGTRMESLTANKPKALVPIDNLPMIFHLFRKYPDKKFIVIGDYKYDVLERYLREFAEVDYTMVCGTGHTGTCSGLKEAISYIPDNERFMLIWCDLVLPKDYEIPESDNNIIGISKDFSCRWKYENGEFAEERSQEFGVAGHFIFNNKSYIEDVPEQGEFVRWLQSKGYIFEEQGLYHTHEYGLYDEWDKLPKTKCRPFNRTWIEDGKFYKEGIDKQGRDLTVRENAWYRALKGKQFRNLPEIYGYNPLCMECVDGENIYEYSDISFEEKKAILKQIVNCLNEVHDLGSIPADENSFRVAYLDKTFDRLKKVRKLVPFANDEIVVVNGKRCRNVFYYQEQLEHMVIKYLPKEFKLLHGDCTFSNMMLKNGDTPILIDPRGYFGNTELYGDEAYDWVKLYYSVVSNYDQFNLKRFRLHIGDNSADLEIYSNNWEELEDYFFELLDGKVSRLQMKLYLAITWLSLTTYAWEDYDSICGAFYNGLYYLEEAFSMVSAYDYYFATDGDVISTALKSIDIHEMDALIDACENTIKSGHKIIASGLGKNVPICDKFVGTMLSLGLDANFLHTNTAVHGDMGMVKPGDLVIILTKSGSTTESVYLEELLEKREGVQLWLLSFKRESVLAQRMQNKVIIDLLHEGDMWDIVPNHSTTINLIVLQKIAMELSKRFKLDLQKDFKPNHPGGAIGASLK